MSIHYQHHAHYCFEDQIGVHGLRDAHIARLAEQLAPKLTSLQKKEDALAAALLDICYEEADLASITAQAASINQQFTHVVVIGAGGSGLSGHVLAWLKPAVFSRLHFLDNIDPDGLDALLERCPLQDTCFIVVSKSGATVETLTQFYVILARIESHLGHDAAAKHFVIITAAHDSPLRETAHSYGITLIDHAPNIGGRFSALTAVGLLPAAVAGLNIHALRRGAKSVADALYKAPAPQACTPLIGAVLQYAFMEKGHTTSVMFPYCERLSGFSDWYRQSWAESLGKEGKGTTPIRAVGSTDQHSQLQLYLQGPHDKLFHLITLNRAGTGHPIHLPPRKDLAYLQGKTTGDVMAAQQKATLETLVKNGCPVRLFTLERLAEEELGALLMHFSLEILFMAALLGVNPFDQPAVEDSKRLAREYLLSGAL